MPTYSYRAMNEKSEMLNGLVKAPSLDVAADVLIEQSLTILFLKEKWELSKNVHIPFFSGSVSAKDLVIFSRQLSILVSASIPLVQSLKILKQQTSKKINKIVSEIVDDVEGGGRFSDALSKHPGAFDDFYVHIIRSGETSGKLDDVLLYLADQMEKDYDLASRIRNAMIYPIFILSGLAVVGTIMMVFVVPKLTAILRESGTQLPLATRVLISVSEFFVGFWWLILILFVGVIVSFRAFIARANGKYIWDLFKLRLPIFGALAQEIAIVRFARSLNTLVTGGVTLTRGFKIVADVVGNSVYKKILLETVKEVEGGNPITSVFSKSPYVPSMVTQMLNVGEKTGKLDVILDKIAAFYTREIDNLLRNLVTLIEPLVMVIMGVGVGMMIAAIILPMYNLASAI